MSAGLSRALTRSRVPGLILTLLSITQYCSFDTSPARAAEQFGTLPYERHVIQWQHGPLRFYTAGNSAGPLLIFIHGSPGGWGDWLPYLTNPALAETYWLAALDRPGYGGSQRGAAQGQLAVQAQAVHAMVRQMRSRQLNDNHTAASPLVLVGHSYGGPVVIRYAMDYPAELQSMVLLASPADPALEEWTWLNQFADSIPGNFLLPVDWLTSNTELKPLRSELDEVSIRYAALHLPVLILQGTSDRLVPAANADYLEKKLQHLASGSLQIKRLPAIDHFFIWSEQQLVLQELQQFLKNSNAFHP
ncbi:MAG: alpha/beta hydrolase [Leptospiraceae bacterium]|nr:alpha/beta hydrolase [Leptospiraceae bacterium]